MPLSFPVPILIIGVSHSHRLVIIFSKQQERTEKCISVLFNLRLFPRCTTAMCHVGSYSITCRINNHLFTRIVVVSWAGLHTCRCRLRTSKTSLSCSAEHCLNEVQLMGSWSKIKRIECWTLLRKRFQNLKKLGVLPRKERTISHKSRASTTENTTLLWSNVVPLDLQHLTNGCLTHKNDGFLPLNQFCKESSRSRKTIIGLQYL